MESVTKKAIEARAAMSLAGVGTREHFLKLMTWFLDTVRVQLQQHTTSDPCTMLRSACYSEWANSLSVAYATPQAYSSSSSAPVHATTVLPREKVTQSSFSSSSVPLQTSTVATGVGIVSVPPSGLSTVPFQVTVDMKRKWGTSATQSWAYCLLLSKIFGNDIPVESRTEL